ncbi:MAG: glycosyltransferase [Bacteroidota bacterium]|nr:glycosyltransferase [Bacteroidota bacterium]
MAKALRIGYITIEDPEDRKGWSGTNYHLLRALEREAHVVALGPLEPWVRNVLSASNYLLLRTTRKRFNYRDSITLSRAYAEILHEKLKNGEFDLLIAPAGLAAIAHLETDVPIVHINDRCLAGALDYHKILSGLFDFSKKEGMEIERMALSRAALNIYGSHWAADQAREHYPDLQEKITVIPFGANLDVFPEEPLERPLAQPLKLLFLGVKWEEKGGPIAYGALKKLRAQGISAKLVICGCSPPIADDPDVLVEGFLDKGSPTQRAVLEDHMRTADLLIIPTRSRHMVSPFAKRRPIEFLC